MKISMFLVVFVLLTTALTASADTPAMKPGLWQNHMEFKTESGELEKQMAQMRQQLEQIPEAQRKMMQNMMESQGLNFDFSNQTFKSCLSKERAEQGDFSLSENNDCRKTGLEKRGGETVLSFSCDSKNSQSTGTVTFHSDAHYSGQSQTTTKINGKPEEITIAHKGEWIGSDCGTVKPY